MIIALLLAFLSSGYPQFSLGSLGSASSPALSGGASASEGIQMSLDWKSDSCSCRTVGFQCWIGRDSGYQESWQWNGMKLQRLWLSVAEETEGALEFSGPEGVGLSVSDTGLFSGGIRLFQMGEDGSEQLSEALQGSWQLTLAPSNAGDSIGSGVSLWFKPDSIWQWGMPASQWVPADPVKHKKLIRWFKQEWLFGWDVRRMAFHVIRPNPQGDGLLFSSFSMGQRCEENIP